MARFTERFIVNEAIVLMGRTCISAISSVRIMDFRGFATLVAACS